MKKIVKYLKNQKEYIKELERKESQIKLMQEYIFKQKNEILTLKRKLQISEKMWDISNKTKIY